MNYEYENSTQGAKLSIHRGDTGHLVVLLYNSARGIYRSVSIPAGEVPKIVDFLQFQPKTKPKTIDIQPVIDALVKLKQEVERACGD